MSDKDPKSPATTSAAYDAMLPLWQKVNSLLGGTETMRAAGANYLPRHTEEGDTAYNERLATNTLVNVLQMTLDTWTGKPFNKPVGINDDVPPEIKAMMPDIDLQGNNIDVFARNWFRDGLAKGFSHVMVSFPKTTPKVDTAGNPLPRTKADDNAEKLRPYLTLIPPENVIFSYSTVTDGVEELLHIRVVETVTEIQGFAEVFKTRIRVITPGQIVIFEERKVKGRKVQWVPVETYNYDLPYIPLVTFYADKQGPMYSKPPLMDLADLNIRHWQSTSDQIAVLTVSRFPMLACSGAIDDTKLRIGPNKWLNTPDTAGRFYYVEHTGAAINCGRQDLLDLEDKMSAYGATFLTRSSQGGGGATGRAIDSADTTCPLQDMAIRFRDAIASALQMMADWLSLPDGGTVTITTDFGLNDEGGASLATLQAARANGDLSQIQFLSELKRFGVLNDAFDFAKNAAELKAEPPKPVAAGPAPVRVQTVVNSRNGGKSKRIKPTIKKPANGA